MSRRLALLLGIAACAGAAPASAAPTAYPTGVTIHDPEKAYRGLTLFNFMPDRAVYLIDMNGTLVNQWRHPDGKQFGPLGKPLPGGRLLAHFATDGREGIGEFDWSGRLLWQYFRRGWSLNHDFERLPNGNTMILAKVPGEHPEIAPYTIGDDRIVELTRAGDVVSSWNTSKHFEELDLSEKGKEEIRLGRQGYDSKYDIYHTNAIQLLPPNRFGGADSRFREGNLLVSQRTTSRVFIIDRESGAIVWHLHHCLDYRQDTVGQHHARMIPRDLPGAGNILIYDNGGTAGYPAKYRFYSRVIELRPTDCEIVWEYKASLAGRSRQSFFSRARGSAQRLPNGNTLISEPTWLRIFEVAAAGEIVWEYVHPPSATHEYNSETEHLYRAYRLHPGWGTTEPNPDPAGRGYFRW